MRAACTTVVAVLALLAGTAPAHAQVHAAVALGKLQYTVTDTPVVELTNATLVVASGQPDVLLTTDQFVERPAAFVRDTGDAHVGVGYDGDGVVAAGRVDPVASGNIYVSAEARSNWITFTLAPHTRIAFTMDAVLDAMVDDRPGSMVTGGGYAWLGILHADDGFGPLLTDSFADSAGDRGLSWVDAVHEARPLAAVWDNDGNGTEQGAVSFQMYVDAGERYMPPGATPPVTTPVPEPAQYALFLLGCGVLGARLRGRAHRLPTGGTS